MRPCSYCWTQTIRSECFGFGSGSDGANSEWIRNPSVAAPCELPSASALRIASVSRSLRIFGSAPSSNTVRARMQTASKSAPSCSLSGRSARITNVFAGFRLQPGAAARGVYGPHLAGFVFGAIEQCFVGAARGFKAAQECLVGAKSSEGALDLVLKLQRNVIARVSAPRAHGAHNRPAPQAAGIGQQHAHEIGQVRLLRFGFSSPATLATRTFQDVAAHEFFRNCGTRKNKSRRRKLPPPPPPPNNRLGRLQIDGLAA